MKPLLTFAALCCAAVALLAAETPPAPGAQVVSLFDGATLANWDGNAKLWRVADGCLTETVRANDFLATTRDYTNFVVRFKIKLTGTNGFINSGFQIRSQRASISSRSSRAFFKLWLRTERKITPTNTIRESALAIIQVCFGMAAA